MGILWLIAVIAFCIIESATAQLVSIWFAGGALVSLVSSLLGASVLLQWILFAVSSAVILILTRPLVKRLTKRGITKTNTDILIGTTVVMTQETDNRGNGGEAKADGKLWTVKSIDGEPIEKGSVVTIEKIEGVKLIVRK